MKRFRNWLSDLYWSLGIPVARSKFAKRFGNSTVVKMIVKILRHYSNLEKILLSTLFLGVLVVCTYLFSTPEDPQVTMWKELAKATEEICQNGLGIDEAPECPSNKSVSIVIAPYARVEPLLHKYEIFRDANQYLFDELLPNQDQLPNLVACLNEETIEIQVCKYVNGPDITRYRTDKILTIRVVKTGEIVHEETFVGGEPRDCQKSESSGTNRLYGSPISDEELANWIAEWLS